MSLDDIYKLLNTFDLSLEKVLLDTELCVKKVPMSKAMNRFMTHVKTADESEISEQELKDSLG